MGFKYGTVGLPNAGRPTLFNVLTKADIEAADFPFRTIEPSAGVAPMPDPRPDQLAEIVKPQRTLPTTMGFIDIIGLIKGTSKDEGLGNRFLINICETEAIGHIIRCFENDNITHVSSEVNPADNIEAIDTELTLADLDTRGRAIHHAQRKARDDDKDVKTELAVLEECLPRSENAGMPYALGLSAEERVAIHYLSFLTLEPTMYITNVSGDSFESNPYLDQMREIAAREGSAAIPVCTAVEADIVKLSSEEHDEFTQELRPEEPDLNHMIHVGCELLNL